MTKFQPKGELPAWRLIYEKLLQNATPDDLITYEQLDEVVDRDFRSNRVPLYRARDELGAQQQHWLAPVPGQGYRIIHAREHMDVAKRHKAKAQRQLGTMVRVGEATDISQLSPEELVHHDKQHMVNVALWRIALYHEARISRIEQILRDDGKLQD